MAITLGFDVYGTLIDTDRIAEELSLVLDGDVRGFVREWRSKQLEYSFRRGLMKCYVDFSVCMRQALDHTCSFYQANLTEVEKDRLVVSYDRLQAFADVRRGLQSLGPEFRPYAFSNGNRDRVAALLGHAGIADCFLDIISVEEMGSFKPDPAVYTHFLEKAGASVQNSWLVSSNPFDVIGAMSSGMSTVWLQRAPSAIFDPWGMKPTLTLNSLDEIGYKVLRQELI